MSASPSSGPRICLTGDTLLTRRLSVFNEPEYLGLRDLIRSCDAAFTNVESPVGNYFDTPHWQRSGMGGSYTILEPQLLEELSWMGINLAAVGSTHAEDFGPQGILNTLSHLEKANFAHAGLGRHLAEARSPGYLDTANGRVALVAATLHYSPGARAGEQRRDTAGYPGVNAIRFKRHYQVPDSVFAEVQNLAKSLGAAAEQGRDEHQEGKTVHSETKTYEFFGRTFSSGADKVSVRSYGNEADIAGVERSVALAKSMADVVIYSCHCHEQGGSKLLSAARRSEIDEPSELAVDIAKRAIDAGADIVVGHGPQIPMGIEIYKGRPIFFGLGSFIFELETLKFLPEEAYERYTLPAEASPIDFLTHRYANDTRGHPADREQWEQFVYVVELGKDSVSSIELHPIDLGFKKPRWVRGRPLLAGPELSNRLLEQAAERCSRYDVKLQIDNGVGRITWG